MFVLVRSCEFLKRFFKCRTWHLEFAAVFILLFLMYLLWGRNHGANFHFGDCDISVEWIGSLAVLFSFGHASISFRLQEEQQKIVKQSGQATVSCYQTLQTYFYLKEACWFSYFVLTGSYAALVGVFIFLIYGHWRKAWRNYHPL